ncbi:MAG: hypothetical protein NTU63_04085 [Candidatus Pacearchaeota archaeon]|nr:hypothetical protein [Candidatus Pacearchaeota archaeon]
MITIESYVGSKDENLKDLMIEVDKPSVNNQNILYIGQVKLLGDLETDLYHYLSSTVMVVKDKEKSRMSVIASREEQKWIKQNLERGLGIKLI